MAPFVQFFLRWAGTEFVRSHIAANGHAWVAGYAIGSEGYIPAFEYAERPENQTWSYGFERQWLFYHVWGRLLFDPATPDANFEQLIEARTGVSSAWSAQLLRAYNTAGRMPLRLASFVYNTWDYTLKVCLACPRRRHTPAAHPIRLPYTLRGHCVP